MANEEHLRIIKQGVEAWNRWRKENLEIMPDLSKANLNGANLRRAVTFCPKSYISPYGHQFAELRQSPLYP